MIRVKEKILLSEQINCFKNRRSVPFPTWPLAALGTISASLQEQSKNEQIQLWDGQTEQDNKIRYSIQPYDHLPAFALAYFCICCDRLFL